MRERFKGQGFKLLGKMELKQGAGPPDLPQVKEEEIQK